MKKPTALALLLCVSACMELSEQPSAGIDGAQAPEDQADLIETIDLGEDANPEDYLLPEELSSQAKKCKRIKIADLPDIEGDTGGGCFEFVAIVRQFSMQRLSISERIDDNPTDLKLNWFQLDSGSKNALIACEQSKSDARFVYRVPQISGDGRAMLESVSCGW